MISSHACHCPAVEVSPLPVRDTASHVLGVSNWGYPVDPTLPSSRFLRSGSETSDHNRFKIQSNVFSFCDSQTCAKQIQRTVLNNLKQGPCIFNSLFVATKPALKRWLNSKKKLFSAAEVEVADFPHARSLFLDFQHRFLFLSAYESPGCKGV